LLRIDEAYELDPGALPDLPALRQLKLYGTRKSIAAAVKARYKGSKVRVHTLRAKTDEWLAIHMYNPFREWVEESKAFGTAACRAYTKAGAAIDALPPDAGDRLADAERVLRQLIRDFNALDGRRGRIDTVCREHVLKAVHDLARRVGMPAELTDHWFDDTRES
jgi:hypothetical protein